MEFSVSQNNVVKSFVGFTAGFVLVAVTLLLLGYA